MSEWQPIETAPKEGAWVLLYFPKGGGWDFDAEIDIPLMAVMRREDGVRWKGYYTGVGPEGDPSHWMALPHAPG